MQYKIAELFGVPVRVMRQMLTSTEYMGWVQYFEHKPPDIPEVQLAIISTLIANAMGSKRKSKVSDFIISKQVEKQERKLRPMEDNEIRSTFATVSVRMD